jgi:hypothetical protein
MSAVPLAAHRFRCLRIALLSALALYLLPGSVMAQKPTAGAKFTVAALASMPARVTLQGRYCGARVLIDARDRNGATRDVSAAALLTIADPAIAAVDQDNMLRPLRNGATVLIARYAGRETRVPVIVRGLSGKEPPRFVSDVIPVLTRAGCNQGACHGAASGKGGFKLSLLGYDPVLDYDAITRANRARRVSPTQPDSSLLLLKPTLTVFHRGGRRLARGTADYRLLRDWIAGGMPGPNPAEPHVTGLNVMPAVRTLAVGQTQRFIVYARYSDGVVCDVTDETLFTASDETVASVAPIGEAKAAGPGEGAVVIRYQSLVGTARVISPYGPPITAHANSPRTAQAAPVRNRNAATPEHPNTRTPEPPNPRTPERLNAQSSDAPAMIDRLVQQKLDALGLTASGNCTDADFLRRAYLDVIGLVPTAQEARAFLTDHTPDKRARLIETLLARPEYVDFWTLRWADILRDSRDVLSEKGMYAFNLWIRRCVAENRPWDQFARQLLLAQGSVYQNGAANYYRTGKTPLEMAENTAQVFLGVRIQCARCHNHPYDRWTQQQYYQMAAFFARVKAKPGERAGENVIFAGDDGEVENPRTHKTAQPCALGAAPLPATFAGDRRQALAEWLTSDQNPFFARVIVNRMWKHFMGRGFVEPVDDLRLTNPPSNAPLFDFLAQDFTRHGYDLQYLMRVIMRSNVYQRSPIAAGNNGRDTRYQSHFAFKRLEAEPLLDSLTAITGVPQKFDGLPNGTRAAQLPDGSVNSYFLDLFGRPARQSSCECERSDDPNLGQLLHMMNSADVNSRLAAKNGRVADLLAAKLPNSRIVEELYLSSLARFPSAEESKRAVAILASAKNRQQAGEDLQWALLNSKEFLFNH